MQRADVIVIGAGCSGAAAAWKLAQRGRHVVLLEQFERGHVLGSSHGATRIFRVAYRDPVYSRLAGAAIPLWRELEQASGQTLLEQTGQLDHGDPGAIEEIEDTLRAGGWGYERLLPEQAAQRWPSMVFDRAVVYSPDGGRVFADRTVDALVSVSEREGADVRFSTPVTRVDASDDRVVVSTDSGSWTAPVAVVAAGAWLPDLLGASVPLPQLRVTEQQPVHFAIRPGYSFPSYVHHVGTDAVDHTFAYGAYGLESPGEGVKLGLERDTEVHDLAARDLRTDAASLAEAVAYAETWLPGADTSVASAASCLFTMAPASHFILDRVGPLVICSACSGHGFKFTPALGEIAADLATGGEQAVPQWRLVS